MFFKQIKALKWSLNQADLMCTYYLGNYKNYQPKNCGVKMRKPKNKILGTMVPLAVKC